MSKFQICLLCASAAIFTLAVIATAAEQTFARAVLPPAGERKAAPEFALKDSSGKTASVAGYQGKVLLLDFWATWCTGCKQEIPWFSEFRSKYQKQGLAVVGVSMDEEGWKAVKPFIKETRLPYRIVLGDDPTAKEYGAGESLPDTALIDRHGRIAASYAGMVDRDDVERNIQALLSEQ